MTGDASIHTRISEAIEEEKRLRRELAQGTITQEEENGRVRVLEEQLDQLWDLLRRRQAERDAGEDPSLARPRSVEQVEGYDA